MEKTKIKFDFSGWEAIMKKKAEEKEQNRKQKLHSFISILEKNKNLFPVQSLYIFGSITRENMFDTYSDIDIAIEGLENHSNFFRIWNDIENVLNHKTDLLELEKCNFKHQIISEGIKIK